MPYEIETKDGIVVRGIPDDVKPDDPSIRAKVEAARQAAKTAAPAPAPKVPLSQRSATLGGTPPSGRLGELSRNAVMEAAAGIPDMFLNAPANAINLGNAAVGTAATMAGRSDMAPLLMEPPNYARRAMQGAGLIQPQGAPQTPTEGYLSAGMQGATAGAAGGLPGMAVGATSGLVGHGVADLTNNPGLGAVAGMAVPVAGNMARDYGNKQVAVAKALESQRGPMTETLNEVRGAGYTMPPSMVKPSLINRILESFGGKVATGQEASLRNADVTDALVRKGIKAPADMGINEAALKDLADQRSGPYREVVALPGLRPIHTGDFYAPDGVKPMMSKTPPTPKVLLEDLQKTRLDMKLTWGEFSKQGSVEAYKKYEALSKKAAGLENQIEGAAMVAGRPDLISELRAARTDIAKLHDVERALNPDRGEVSALDLSRARDKGVPLTGELLTAAKMGSAFPKAVQRPETVGSPAVNNLTAGISSAAGGGIGAFMGGWPGATAGAAIGAIGVPVAQTAVRKALLSPLYQKLMATPDFDASALSKAASNVPMTPKEHAALIAYIISQRQSATGE